MQFAMDNLVFRTCNHRKKRQQQNVSDNDNSSRNLRALPTPNKMTTKKPIKV